MSQTRPYHHGNLRAALLDAAEQSIAERGVDELSLRGLARAVGVSHGAPAAHFADRQALLDALAERGFERLAKGVRSAAEGSAPHLDARLRAVAAAYVAFAAANPALLELMYAGKPHPELPGRQDAANRVYAVVLGLVNDGISSGTLAPRQPQYYTLPLFATVRGIAALLTSGVISQDGIDQLIADATEIFLRGAAVRD
jgi:AcrR family transcriptional regulator